jgi:hypothetical protein
MKQRIALWGFAGLIVAGCWVLLGLAIPPSTEPVLWSLARLTCPIVPVGLLGSFFTSVSGGIGYFSRTFPRMR